MDRGTKAGIWTVVAVLLALAGIWGVIYADTNTAGSLTLDLVLAAIVLYGAYASFRRARRVRAGSDVKHMAMMSKWLQNRAVEGSNITALRAYAVEMKTQVDGLGVGASPSQMSEAPLDWAEPWLLVRLHGRAVQVARKAVDPKGRGHWGMVDEGQFMAESCTYLAARTGWDQRAVLEMMESIGHLGMGRMARTAEAKEHAEKVLRDIDAAYKAAPERTHRGLLESYDRRHGYPT